MIGVWELCRSLWTKRFLEGNTVVVNGGWFVWIIRDAKTGAERSGCDVCKSRRKEGTVFEGREGLIWIWIALYG